MANYYRLPGGENRRFSFDSVRAHFSYHEFEYQGILVGLFAISFIMFMCTLMFTVPDVPHFQIDSIHTTLPSDDGNGTFRSNFKFSIPKLFRTETIKYDFDSVSLFQDYVLISNTTMSPVFQADSKTTCVEAEFVLSPNLIQIGDVVKWTVDIEATLTLGPDTYCRGFCFCIKRYPQSHRPADCGIDTSVYFPKRKRSARIRCTDVKVDFSANSTDFGRLLKPPTRCYVYYDNSKIW